MAGNPILDLARELVGYLEAAGLMARTAADPDAGPAALVRLPDFDWDPARVAVGCGKVQRADIRCEIVLVGAGSAPEQVEQLAADAWTAWQAIPLPPWRITAVTPGESPDAPIVTITVER